MCNQRLGVELRDVCAESVGIICTWMMIESIEVHGLSMRRVQREKRVRIGLLETASKRD